MFLHKLKTECQQNFDDELKVKYVKIIGRHVPQAPVPQWLSCLP